MKKTRQPSPIKKAAATSIVFNADTRKQIDSICAQYSLSLSECLHRLVDYYSESQQLAIEASKPIRATILDAMDRGQDVGEWLDKKLDDKQVATFAKMCGLLGERILRGVSAQTLQDYEGYIRDGLLAFPVERLKGSKFKKG